MTRAAPPNQNLQDRGVDEQLQLDLVLDRREPGRRVDRARRAVATGAPVGRQAREIGRKERGEKPPPARSAHSFHTVHTARSPCIPIPIPIRTAERMNRSLVWGAVMTVRGLQVLC